MWEIFFDLYIIIVISSFPRAVDINSYACQCSLKTLLKNDVSQCDVIAMDLV